MYDYYRKLLLITFSFFLLLPINGIAKDILTISDDSSTSLLPYLSYWVPDYDINPLIAIANSENFKPVQKSLIPALDKDIWYRFTVKAEAPYHNQLVINFNEVLYDEIEVYFFAQGKWQSFISGLNANSKDNITPINHRFITLPISLKPNVESEVFFRVRSLTNTIISPILQTPFTFFETSIKQTAISAGILSILVGMILFCIFIIKPIFSVIKIFTLTGFLFSCLLSILYFDGHLTSSTGDNAEFSRLAYIFITSLQNIFSLLLCRYFFDMRKNSPWLNHGASFLIIIYLSISIGAILVGPEIFAGVFPRFTLLVLLIMAIVGVDAIKRKENGSGFYIAAIACYILTIIYTVILYRGVIEFSIDNRLLTYVGPTLLALLIGFAVNKQASIQKHKKLYEMHMQGIKQTTEESKKNFYKSIESEVAKPLQDIYDKTRQLENSRLDSMQKQYVKSLIDGLNALKFITEKKQDEDKVNH